MMSWLPRLPALPAFDAVVERDYRIACNARMLHINKVALVVILIVYNIFLIDDVSLIPDAIWMSAILRCGLVTPVILIYMACYQRMIDADPASQLPGHLNAVVGVLIFASIIALQASTRAATGAEYFTGCIVVMIGFNSVRFGNITDQLSGTLAMCGLFGLGMMEATVVPADLRVDAAVSILVSAALTLLGAYRNEYVARSSFLAETEAKSLRDALADRNAALQRLSRVDPLTGVANRRAFDERVGSGATARSCAVLMIDVDHFKAFNDRYGHLTGDECLVRVATALAGEIGAGDCLARFGGEEFAVILDAVDPDDVETIGERLRRAVERMAIPHTSRPDGLDCVTVSIGGSRRETGGAGTLADCVAAADRALYESKSRGRNRVTLASGVSG